MKFHSPRIPTCLTGAAFALSCVIGIGASPAHAAEAPAMRPATSAKDACQIIVEAAKKDDFETIRLYTTTMSMGGGKHRMEAERRFHRMHRDELTRLKDLSCGSEHKADSHAVVEAESGGKKRLVPFIEEKGGWKFDLRTYMSFYRAEMKAYAQRQRDRQREPEQEQKKKST